MSDETETGPAGAPDRRGHSPGGAREQSPLQARAEFLKNWSWELVVSLNRGACARGGAQHGFNQETQVACASEWARKQEQVISLNLHLWPAHFLGHVGLVFIVLAAGDLEFVVHVVG